MGEHKVEFRKLNESYLYTILLWLLQYVLYSVKKGLCVPGPFCFIVSSLITYDEHF